MQVLSYQALISILSKREQAWKSKEEVITNLRGTISRPYNDNATKQERQTTDAMHPNMLRIYFDQ